MDNSSRTDEDSAFPEQQIHDPTSAGVWSWPSAMIQDVLVRATSLFQSIGQFGHAVKRAMLVNAGRQLDTPPVGCELPRFHATSLERISEDISDNISLVLQQSKRLPARIARSREHSPGNEACRNSRRYHNVIEIRGSRSGLVNTVNVG